MATLNEWNENRLLTVGARLSRCAPPLAAIAVFAFFLFSPASVIAQTGFANGASSPLNDTGITSFSTAAGDGFSTEPADYPGQDGRYGRDAAAAGQLAKIGAGSKGFDFTKIANNGSELPATAALGESASHWACTRDNVTRLMWEVKTTSGLRSLYYGASWYDSNSATNGGSPGDAGGNLCFTPGRCNTERYVEDVNAAGMCSYNDWRMPSADELMSIVDYGRTSPAIDIEWFPNTGATSFWSASAYAAYSPRVGYSGFAWYVNFWNGDVGGLDKYYSYSVRLVRTVK